LIRARRFGRETLGGEGQGTIDAKVIGNGQKNKMPFDIAGEQDYQRHPFSNRKPTAFHHAYH